MKVECGDCPAKYAVADERIAGKKVRLRCKRCGASIIVNGKENPPTVACLPASHPLADGQHSTPSPPPGAERNELPGDLPPSRPPAPTILGGLEAPDGQAILGGEPQPARPFDGFDSLLGRVPDPTRGRSIPAPQGDGEKYRVAVTKEDLRWMSTAEVRQALSAGAIDATSFALVEKTGRWQALGEIPQLAELLEPGVAADTSGTNPSRPSCPPPSRRNRPPQSLPPSLSGESVGDEDSSPEETVPFSLDPSRASNRPSFLKDTSFFAEAKRAASRQEQSVAAGTDSAAEPTASTGSTDLPVSPAVPRSPNASRYVAVICLLASCGVLAAWFFRTDLQRFLAP